VRPEASHDELVVEALAHVDEPEREPAPLERAAAA
jgi:hypothetical protein